MVWNRIIWPEREKTEGEPLSHGDISTISHIILGIVVIAFGLMHKRDLKRIIIEFKNGKDKKDGGGTH